MTITSLPAVFSHFETYGLKIPLCASGGRPLGRYAYHLYYQQTAGNVSSQVKSPTYTRTHRILIIMTTMLVIFAAVCILGVIMDLLPLRSPFNQQSVPVGLSPSPPPKAPAGCKLRGDGQGTVQTFVSLTMEVHHGARVYAAANAGRGRVNPLIPALAENVGATKVDSTNRGRTPGTQAGSRCATDPVAQNPASSTLAYSLSEASLPIIEEGASNEPSAGPTFSSLLVAAVGSCMPRGSGPNPAQLGPSPFQLTGASGNIKKSLYPLILDPVGLTNHNDATSSSPARLPQESPWNHLDRNLSAAVRHLKNCYMLVVAVGVDGLKDPSIDLKFLRGISESAVLRLRWLSNRKVTHKLVRRKLRKLYIKAQKTGSSSWVLVYLTGMGDHRGNMCLFGRNTIGVQDLEGWLAEFDGPRLHVGVVFDICRRTCLSLAPSRHCGLAPVWSCSIEQWAYGLDFGENLPSSCFLNSLFLAAHDVLVGYDSFEAAFKHRMTQQGKLLQFIYQKRHEISGHCKKCPEGGKCALPEPQVAEWGSAGFNTFLILGKLIVSEFPHVAHRVEAGMTKKMMGWKFLCDESVNAAATPVAAPLSSKAHHFPITCDTSSAWDRSGVMLQTTAPSVGSQVGRMEFASPRNNVSIFS